MGPSRNTEHRVVSRMTTQTLSTQFACNRTHLPQCLAQSVQLQFASDSCSMLKEGLVNTPRVCKNAQRHFKLMKIACKQCWATRCNKLLFESEDRINHHDQPKSVDNSVM